MKVNVEEISPIQSKINVLVSPEAVEKAINKSYNEINRKVKLPGFRTGKAPRRMLERHYRKDAISSTLDYIIRSSMGEAIMETGLRVVGEPSLENIGSLEADEGFSYTVKVDVVTPPQVSDYENLPAKKREVIVTDCDVDNEVKRIQENMARLEPVEDREKVELGDYVVCELKTSLDGKMLESKEPNIFNLEVKDGKILQGFLPEAEGHVIGDVLDISRERLDEGVKKSEAQEMPGEFHIFLKGIKKRVFPPIDDELAKDMGIEGIESMLALRGLIRERLTEKKESDAELEFITELMNVFIERNPFDLPSSFIDGMTMQMVEPYVQQLMSSQQNMEDGEAKKMIERLMKDSRPDAERMSRSSLLLLALAEKMEIEASEEDIEAFYKKMAEEKKEPVEKTIARVEKESGQENIINTIKRNKALDYVKEKADVTIVKACVEMHDDKACSCVGHSRQEKEKAEGNDSSSSEAEEMSSDNNEDKKEENS